MITQLGGCLYTRNRRRTGVTRSSRIRNRASSSKGRQSIDAAVTSLRSIWDAVEKAQGVDHSKLKMEILESLTRLKSRIESQLSRRSAVLLSEPLLFPLIEDERISAATESHPGPTGDRFPK